VALVVQGGGALGAYQAGVYEALTESGIHPDWIAGISIGGINAAIIAGNPPNMRVDRLREFWTQVTSDVPRPWFGWAEAKGDGARNLLNQFSANLALMQGPVASSRPGRSRRGCSHRGRSRPAASTTPMS
jgi:NTE family protein